jgi:hypothetical protein
VRRSLRTHAKIILIEIRANMVRVGSEFSATPFKAQISNAERKRFPASSRRRLRLVIGGRDMEAGLARTQGRK